MSCVRGSLEMPMHRPVEDGDSECVNTLEIGCGAFACTKNLSSVNNLETCCLTSFGSSCLAVHNSDYGAFNAVSHE